MGTWKDAVIVTLIAIGSSILVGLLGFFADKTGDPEGKAKDEEAFAARRGAISK